MSKAINVLDTLIAIRNATQVNQRVTGSNTPVFTRAACRLANSLSCAAGVTTITRCIPRGGWTLLDNMHRRVAVVEVSEQQEDSVRVSRACKAGRERGMDDRVKTIAIR